MVIERHFS
jgi:hypothetical protein